MLQQGVEASPRYSRPVPERWEELLAYSKTLLESTADGQITFPVAAEMYYKVGELNDEELEENRYYGLGLGMCVLARELADPVKREDAVVWAARNLVLHYENWSQSDMKGMRAGDISASSSNFPFEHLMKSAKGSIPAEQLLVIDSLIEQAHARKSELQSPDLYKDRSPFMRLELVAEGERLVSTVGANADAAAFTVIRRVVAKVYGGLGIINQDKPYDEQELGPVVDPDLIRSLRLKRVATHCARLRLDEFMNNELFDEVVAVGEQGEALFSLGHLKTTPAEPDNSNLGVHESALLHRQRLKCPAIHVRGLIALVMDISPEIISRAQEQILVKAARYEQQSARWRGLVTY